MYPEKKLLIVFRADLKESLGMGADGAHLGSLGAYDDVSAVAALPYLDVALLEYFLHFYVFQQGTIALLMALLDGADHTELCRQLGEALFFSGLGKSCVHIGPLKVFALSRGFKVFRGAADSGQFLEAAASRFSEVLPIPASSLNHILACSFSLSAVLAKMAAICSKPSLFALEAK